jgi:hypothetical protein
MNKGCISQHFYATIVNGSQCLMIALFGHNSINCVSEEKILRHREILLPSDSSIALVPFLLKKSLLLIKWAYEKSTQEAVGK